LPSIILASLFEQNGYVSQVSASPLCVVKRLLLQGRGRGSVPYRETFDFFFCERIKNCADSHIDTTTLQRSKNAGPFFNDTDDNRDIVHYFDYTIDFPDYHAAVNDYDLKAVLLADYQQVKTYF
jgi:hypothetical protein